MEFTASSSSALPTPSRAGSFLKELDDLKKLLHQISKEIEASGSCSTDVAKSDEATSQLHNKDLLDDVHREVSEISQLVGKGGNEGGLTAKGHVGIYGQLGQTIEENHQKSIASIYQTYESVGNIQRRRHLEVIRAIQEKESNPTRR